MKLNQLFKHSDIIICKLSYTYKNNTQTIIHTMHTNYIDTEYQNITDILIHTHYSFL